MHALAPAAALHRARGFRTLGRLHDGNGGLLVGKEAVLGYGHRDVLRSGANSLKLQMLHHARYRSVCSTSAAVGAYGSPGASNSIEQYPRYPLVFRIPKVFCMSMLKRLPLSSTSPSFTWQMQ